MVTKHSHFHRLSLADDARQKISYAAVAGKADMPIGHDKLGIAARDANISGKCEPQPEAGAGSMDCGNDRLFHAPDLIDHLVSADDPQFELR